jgi:hypothetical protein
MEEMALVLGMITETKDGIKKGKQSQLSYYENLPEGPPWELVHQYADYFGLTGNERFQFFLEALSVSKKVIVDIDNIKTIPKDTFIRFLAGILIFERPTSMGGVPQDKVFDLEELITKLFPDAFL